MTRVVLARPRQKVPVYSLLAILISPFVVPTVTSAQNQTGRLILTVNDTTGGSLPTATVTVTGLEPANRALKIAPQQTTMNGIATFDLVPGRYAVVAEFTGFETSAPREVRVRAGDNRLTITLALARLKDEVIVGRDQQVAGSDRASTFGSMVTREQIDQLSDDPAILRQQLEDLAGPAATILVDSFEGGQLPNKSQIRSIRISRDQFAAESHSAGGIRIEIVTQPGQGAIRGQVRTNFYTSRLDGSNPLVDRAPPARNLNGGMNLSGGLLKDRMSFSLNWNGTNNYTSPVQIASGSSNTGTRVLPIKTRTTSETYSGGIDWAVTTNQTARFSVSRYNSVSRNAGLGAYDAPERAYTSENPEWYIQAGHTGPIGRRMMLYNRFYYDAYSSIMSSAVEAPTFIVPDDVNRGGAQRRGRTDTKAVYYSSDLDYVRGRHSLRSGIELQHTRFHSDSETNYLGTYYFESPAAFDAGQPRSFTRRIGDPDIRYSNTQFSIYFQDDVRLSKSLTMTPGVRYEIQTHVNDFDNVMPRFGVTWAPGAGRTTYRASLGIFHDWLSTSIYQQTLQFDGFRMQEVNIADPSFPDPGPLGPATPVQRYLLAEDRAAAHGSRKPRTLAHHHSDGLGQRRVRVHPWHRPLRGREPQRARGRGPAGSAVRERDPGDIRRQVAGPFARLERHVESGGPRHQSDHRPLLAMAARAASEWQLHAGSSAEQHRRRLLRAGHGPRVRMGTLDTGHPAPRQCQLRYGRRSRPDGLDEPQRVVATSTHHPHRIR
jgi:hypothetical protein